MRLQSFALVLIIMWFICFLVLVFLWQMSKSLAVIVIANNVMSISGFRKGRFIYLRVIPVKDAVRVRFLGNSKQIRVPMMYDKKFQKKLSRFSSLDMMSENLAT